MDLGTAPTMTENILENDVDIPMDSTIPEQIDVTIDGMDLDYDASIGDGFNNNTRYIFDSGNDNEDDDEVVTEKNIDDKLELLYDPTYHIPRFQRVSTTTTHYPHVGEKHVLAIICRQREWHWTLLEKGYGLSDFLSDKTEPDVSTSKVNTRKFDPNGLYYAPRLCWRTTPFTGDEVEKHKKVCKNYNGTNSCNILDLFIPQKLLNEIMYGIASTDDKGNRTSSNRPPHDRKLILKHRNQLPIPPLRIIVMTSNELCLRTNLCTADKGNNEDDDEEDPENTHLTSSETDEPIHHKFLKLSRIDSDKALRYMFDQVPVNMYRIHPEDMAVPHLKIGKEPTNSLPHFYDKEALELLQNITLEQWAQVKAADAMFQSRPSLIVDASDESITITATKPVNFSDNGGSSSSASATTFTTLTIIGQYRTSSLRSRFHMLNECCSDKLAHLMNEDDDGNTSDNSIYDVESIVNEILAHLLDPNSSSKAIPLFTTEPQCEAICLSVSELVLFLQTIARNWIGSLLFHIDSTGTCDDISPQTTTPSSVVDNQLQQQPQPCAKIAPTSTNTIRKPIIIVTGNDSDIVHLLLDPNVCRQKLPLPLHHSSGSNAIHDEADFLRQADLVKRKHLSIFGVTSFMIDMTHSLIASSATNRQPPIICELIGARVAKQMNDFYEVGPHTVMRGTINSYRKEINDVDVVDSKTRTSTQYSFMILFDDGTSNVYRMRDLYDLLMLYVKHFEFTDDSNKEGMLLKQKHSKIVADRLKKCLDDESNWKEPNFTPPRPSSSAQPNTNRMSDSGMTHTSDTTASPPTTNKPNLYESSEDMMDDETNQSEESVVSS